MIYKLSYTYCGVPYSMEIEIIDNTKFCNNNGDRNMIIRHIVNLTKNIPEGYKIVENNIPDDIIKRLESELLKEDI